MSVEAVRAAEEHFFGALLQGNAAALSSVLGEDFLLIDVMTGSEIPRAVLLDLIGSGALRFHRVARAEPTVRRYTHVYVEQAGGWRLVAAQGTPIAGATAP